MAEQQSLLEAPLIVRNWPIGDVHRCPFPTRSGRWTFPYRKFSSLLNNPVETHENRLRNLDAERLRSLAVDDQFELNRLLDQKI
jgi:hypothetical protein